MSYVTVTRVLAKCDQSVRRCFALFLELKNILWSKQSLRRAIFYFLPGLLKDINIKVIPIKLVAVMVHVFVRFQQQSQMYPTATTKC